MPRNTTSRKTRNSIASRAANTYEEAKERLENTRDSTESFIKKKPFTSVGIAIGIGAVIGAAIALGSYRAYENRQTSLWDRLTGWF